MHIITKKLIEIAREKHPEAISTVEALDTYAQEVYKGLQADMGNPNL